MRVIAGELRGKRLNSPKDHSIRPTTDRVKESLFNIIADYVDEETVVFDLFSGSGSLGIEALSRGAKRSYFCDKSRDGFALTKDNIKHCNMEDRSFLFLGDYRKALEQFDEKAHLIFIDPPYGLDLWKNCLDEILLKDKLRVGGIVVLERTSNHPLTDISQSLELIKERRYGVTTLSIYRRRENE